jgi:hypothetical protein
LRRSHRLALSVVCALALGTAAGRLATRGASRASAAQEAMAASAAGDAERAASTAARTGAAPNPDATEIADAVSARAAASAIEFAPASALARRSREEGRAAPIVLEDPQTALGNALAIHGRDPGAPRAIELWRLVGSRAARVATGHSRSDGTVAFPALVLPAGEVLLVASPRGAGPAADAASEPVRASRDPSSPQLLARDETLDASAGGALLSLRVEPAEPGGEIVVARRVSPPDAAGVEEIEIARVAVAAAADGARVPLDLSIEIAPEDAEFLVAQRLPDGRRSPWRRVGLESRERENADAVEVAE